MKYKFSEVVDIAKLKKLMKGLYLASGINSSIVDIEGTILISMGWRDICEKFHAANVGTESLCKQSDLYLQELIRESNNIKPYFCYICLNGLMHAAAPIFIDGEHLATIYHGQFLLEEPDIEKFRNQAKRYGFDEEDYLKALADVPVYSEEKLDSIMHCFIQLAEMLGEMGVDRLRLIESQKRALQEREEKLKTIINNAPNLAIQSYDEQGKILFANKASESIFGWVNKEVVGKTLNELSFDQEVTTRFMNLLKKTNNETSYAETECIFTNMRGVKKCIYSTVSPIHLAEEKKEFICMYIDITEKKRFEKEMQRLDQLNLIGEMAAGIAHEIRNPMTTIRGYLQLLQNKKEKVQVFKSQFELMLAEIDRANSIITEFLSLAKNKPFKTEKCNLNDIIAKVFPLIQADTYTKNMEIIFEPGEVSLVHLNVKEIVQLILNLCRNGLEAMKAGGCLTLKTFKDGQDIVLSVQDEGAGIPVENLDKIGKPFFSTKDNGTGLGLASCYKIAAHHKAIINIDTNPSGTTFFIRFTCEDADKVYNKAVIC